MYIKSLNCFFPIIKALRNKYRTIIIAIITQDLHNLQNVLLCSNQLYLFNQDTKYFILFCFETPFEDELFS